MNIPLAQKILDEQGFIVLAGLAPPKIGETILCGPWPDGSTETAVVVAEATQQDHDLQRERFAAEWLPRTDDYRYFCKVVAE